MILWFIVGFIVWTLCILFMLAIFKGGNIQRGVPKQPLVYCVGRERIVKS